MLTLGSILKTQRQMTAYGEGRHRFGGSEARRYDALNEANPSPDGEDLVIRRVWDEATRTYVPR